MAEYVQQTLEEMTNEVLQLERVGLFDHSDIKKIVNRRTRHEYKLRRRAKAKEDFMNYIQYEMNVLSLIAVRRKQHGYTHKKAEIEGAVLKRILSLFHIACRNWPQSQDLWLARIKFVQSKMKNKSLVSSLYGRMLQVITNQPNLWLLHAKFEFEIIHSIESARHVLLKGIAFNKECAQLWHEYFRLELLFVDFVRRRQKLSEAKLSNMVEIPRYSETGTIAKDVRRGKVACTVYTHARKAFPDNYECAVKFLDITQHFSWTGLVEETIFTELFEAFADRPELWQLKCSRLINGVNHAADDYKAHITSVERKCHKLLKRMLHSINSESSWSIYLTVNWQLLDHRKGDEDAFQKFLLSLALVERKGLLSEFWMLKWVRLLAAKGDTDETVALYDKAVQTYRRSEQVWASYIEYTAALDVAQAVDVFYQARAALKEESLSLWQLITQLSIGADEGTLLTDLYEVAVGSHHSVAGVMKGHYMHWVYRTQGIAKARKLYNRLRETVSLTVEFFQTYLRMEKSESTPDMDRLRKAYRHMLQEFGAASVDGWLEYIEMEQTVGDVGKISVLYSQAIKTLDDDLTQEFIHKHTLRAVNSTG